MKGPGTIFHCSFLKYRIVISNCVPWTLSPREFSSSKMWLRGHRLPWRIPSGLDVADRCFFRWRRRVVSHLPLSFLWKSYTTRPCTYFPYQNNDEQYEYYGLRRDHQLCEHDRSDYIEKFVRFPENQYARHRYDFLNVSTILMSRNRTKDDGRDAYVKIFWWSVNIVFKLFSIASLFSGSDLFESVNQIIIILHA